MSIFALRVVQTQEYLRLIHTLVKILPRSEHKVHVQKCRTWHVVTETFKPCLTDTPQVSTCVVLYFLVFVRFTGALAEGRVDFVCFEPRELIGKRKFSGPCTSTGAV